MTYEEALKVKLGDMLFYYEHAVEGILGFTVQSINEIKNDVVFISVGGPVYRHKASLTYKDAVIARHVWLINELKEIENERRNLYHVS